MNVYELAIWRSVKHDGVFSHNGTRLEVIHALNEERARKKITLAPEKKYGTGGQHTIEVSGEFVYSVRRTGTVRKQVFYVYSDGRSPRPIGDK